MIEQILQADRYLQVDQVERARDIYQRVVDMDPGNAIAVVGLARCALAEGEDRRAYELASAALEIDPENDMARRMEARLSEILRGRGEDVDRPAAAATPNPHEMRSVVTEETHAGENGSPALAVADSTPAPVADSTPAPVAATPQPPPAPSAAAVRTPPPIDRPPTPKPPPTTARERPVRKSFFDRLMGR